MHLVLPATPATATIVASLHSRGHDVGPVLEESDAPEALGLALRAEVAAAAVQPLQARVVLGLALSVHLQIELACLTAAHARRQADKRAKQG